MKKLLLLVGLISLPTFASVSANVSFASDYIWRGMTQSDGPAIQGGFDYEADKEGEKGVIINTASIAGYEGQIGQSAYSASKAGVIGLTLTAARDLARHGIRVCTIAPGIFDTPLMSLAKEENKKALLETTQFPHRFGKTKEFGQLAGHIVENSYLNGETIRLDSAMRMGAQ